MLNCYPDSYPNPAMVQRLQAKYLSYLDLLVIAMWMLKAWLDLSSQAALMGLEAQQVIALRLMRLAAGGALAESEASRMITEKVEAFSEAQAATAIATMKGHNSNQVAKKALGVYRKRIRRNRRRLTK
jgi:hypothetical protein